MSLTASVRHFVPAYRFDISVPGIKQIGFSSLSEIETERPETKICEATLSRGLSEGDHDMAGWAWDKDPRNIIVAALNRAGDVVQRIRIRGARPVGYRLGGWDANKSEVLIESLVFEYDAAQATIGTVIAPSP